MKTISVMCVLALVYGAPASAGQAPAQAGDAPAKASAPSAGAPSATQDLVKAARTDKAKRKTSSAKVITNKDVKKAKGKLVVLPAKPDVPHAETDTIGPIGRQDAQIHARNDAQARVEKAQKNVDKLQKELETIEQEYYAENDPNYRDQVITQRFTQGKQQLDGARRELADARDALNKIEPQK